MARDRTQQSSIARRSRRRRVLAAGAGIAGGLLLTTALAASPAGAKVIDHEHYEGTDSFVIDDLCAFPIQVHAEFSGTFHFRVGKNRFDQAFFVHDNFRFSETWSANGEHFTLSGHGVFLETRAVPLGDDVFEFHAREAGQPFVVTDSDGEVLLRDRGVIRHRAVFDTEGDSQPGGILLQEFEPEFGGPHPGFFIDPTEACRLLAPAP